MTLFKDKPVATKPAPLSASVAPPASNPTKLNAVLRELLGWVLSALGAIAIGPPLLNLPLEEAVYYFLFTYAIFILLWKGNGLLTNTLARYYPWGENPAKRFLISIVATLLLTIVVVVFVNVVFLAYKENNVQDLLHHDWVTTITVPVVVTFFISLFFHSWHFLQSWRQTAINAERLQKESIASQYESLKAQVNPHFLFNSLNVLTSLVETDQQQAVKFIRKLSEVYRYVLDSRQKEVVPLPEELYFLESYIYLQKIRHGQALLLYNDLPQDTGLLVVPLALQMLLENAIKHNMTLEEEPLKISLYLEQEYLVVKNNIQVRRIREASTGTGLANIEARYSYLTTKPILIQHTAQDFTVKIPILNFKP